MTGIQWTQEVWNPTTGCDKVSPGCGLPRFDGDDTGGCYALTMAKRLKRMGQAKYQNDGDPRTSGPGFGVTEHSDALGIPLHWKKPRRIFVNSMSDLFHDDISGEFIARVFAVMAVTPQHTYQLLTKRHGRMKSLLSGGPRDAWLVPRHPSPFVQAIHQEVRKLVPNGPLLRWPLPNLWLGVSAEDQHWAEIRVHALLSTPAAVRWVSAEPLLGPIDFRNLRASNGALIDALCGDVKSPRGEIYAACPGSLSWIVTGGESGADAREMDLQWPRAIIRDCRNTRTPVFMKQVGSVAAASMGPRAGLHGGNPDTWPEDLCVREYPGIAQGAAA
jgi:protein gp37